MVSSKQSGSTLRQVLTKMVPYLSLPYAEHVLKTLNLDSNTKATLEHITILIEAANSARELMVNFEK